MPAAAWLLLASLLAQAKETSPTRTIMAINAGGDTTIAADGEVFERDRYYQGGVVSKKGKDLVINGTNSPALYQVRILRGSCVFAPPPCAPLCSDPSAARRRSGLRSARNCGTRCRFRSTSATMAGAGRSC